MKNEKTEEMKEFDPFEEELSAEEIFGVDEDEEEETPVTKLSFTHEVNFDEVNDYVEHLKEIGSMGGMADAMYVLRAFRQSIDAFSKEIGKIYKSAETMMGDMLEDTDTDITRGTLASASVKTELYPSVVDMMDFLQFMVDEGRDDLIQKRPNAAPFKEYFEANGCYPAGLDGFMQRKVNLRKR